MNVKEQLAELMQNVAEEMKSRWDFYRHAAYLKKRGWTEADFHQNEDPDHNKRADAIKDYYHGYKHYHVWQSTRGDPWIKFNGWTDCYQEINKWCTANCKDKWRHDILRVYATASGEWYLNEIGGGDCLFYAFKDPKDYTMFLLKWA